MVIKTPKELFLMILSHARQGTEKGAKIFQEIGQSAQDPQVKEVLEARAFVSQKVLATLDECFVLLGERPVEINTRLQETFVEDFRKELADIQSPAAKHLFILAKLSHLAHFRIGEYEALIAASDTAGHYGVGLLLETCLADTVAFVERARRLIRSRVEMKVAERAAAASSM